MSEVMTSNLKSLIHNVAGLGQTSCHLSVTEVEWSGDSDEVTCPACKRALRREAQRVQRAERRFGQ